MLSANISLYLAGGPEFQNQERGNDFSVSRHYSVQIFSVTDSIVVHEANTNGDGEGSKV